jgi:ribosome-binding ATPase
MAELMLKDLESVGKRLEKVEKSIKIASTPPEKKMYEDERELLKKVSAALDLGKADAVINLIKNAPVATIPLLSAKNFLVIANIAESELEGDTYKTNAHYQALVKHFGQERVIAISAKIEFELSRLPDDEARDMMEMFGLKEPSLQKIIKATYQNLGLITFFTCGPKEIHAWPIRSGTTIKKAAGEIHSDLERGFICAEIFNYYDLVAAGTMAALKASGKTRTEGAEYLVRDGDIILVRFAV